MSQLNSSRNHYELLEISSYADEETLRKAFRKLSKKLHPDTTLLPQNEAAERFQQICEAYELLTDPILRKDYDLNLYKRSLENRQSQCSLGKSFQKKIYFSDRRPFSGGELFSLLLLGIALLISLLLAIILSIAQGRELIVRPTWLMVSQYENKVYSIGVSNESIATRTNTFKSALFGSS